MRVYAHGRRGGVSVGLFGLMLLSPFLVAAWVLYGVVWGALWLTVTLLRLFFRRP